jgi:hypothetical protein
VTDRILKSLVIVGVAAGAVLLVLIFVVPLPSESVGRLQYLQFYYEAFKALLVGVGVGVLAIVVPHHLNEAKYRFERLRDSRRAYSEAHTGITYIEYRLAVLEYGAAIALIEEIHVKKHMAETYDELAIHLSRKGQTVNEWSDRLAKKLDKLTREVGLDYSRWANSPPEERLTRLLHASQELTRPPQ